MSLLLQQLQESKLNNKLLSFVEYDNDSNFFCGYVLDFTDEMVTIKHVTKFGKNDGLITLPLKKFHRIDFDDDYALAMEHVILNCDKIYTPNNFNINFSKEESYYFSVLKHLCGNEDVIVSVELSDKDYFSGYIISFSDVDFILQSVGKDGEDLGKSIFKMDDIISIQIDDVDNRRRNLLFKWRKNNLS